MKEQTRLRLVNPDLWIRAFYMVLFMVANGMAKAIIFLLALFQFFSVLLTGRANEALLAFGKNLAIYVYEILEFETFNSEIRPFPFSNWPDVEHTGEEWLDESDLDSDQDAASDQNAETELDAEAEAGFSEEQETAVDDAVDAEPKVKAKKPRKAKPKTTLDDS